MFLKGIVLKEKKLISDRNSILERAIQVLTRVYLYFIWGSLLIRESGIKTLWF